MTSICPLRKEQSRPDNAMTPDRSQGHCAILLWVQEEVLASRSIAAEVTTPHPPSTGPATPKKTAPHKGVAGTLLRALPADAWEYRLRGSPMPGDRSAEQRSAVIGPMRACRCAVQKLTRGAYCGVPTFPVAPHSGQSHTPAGWWLGSSRTRAAAAAPHSLQETSDPSNSMAALISSRRLL